jgi:hypothetical protein
MLNSLLRPPSDFSGQFLDKARKVVVLPKEIVVLNLKQLLVDLHQRGDETLREWPVQPPGNVRDLNQFVTHCRRPATGGLKAPPCTVFVGCCVKKRPTPEGKMSKVVGGEALM